MPKKPAAKRRRRHLGSFHLVPDQGGRNNPQSLRRTLYDITENRYGKELQVAAARLQALLRRRHGRTLHATFSDEILYNILNDKSHIKYYHLEAYARTLGIPTALLLLYSRLIANQQDNAPHYSVAMIAAFQKVCTDAAEKLGQNTTAGPAFQIDDLLRWAEIYETELARSEQRTLFATDDD